MAKVRTSDPFVNGLSIAICVGKVRTRFMQVTRILAVGKLANIFHGVRANARISEPERLRCLVTIDVNDDLFLLLLQDTILNDFPLRIAIFLHQNVLILTLLLIVLLANRRIPCFLPQVVIRNPARQHAVSQPAARATVQPFHAIAKRRPSILVGLMDVDNGNETRARHVALTRLRARVGTRIAPEARLNDHIMASARARVIGRTRLTSEIVLVLRLRFGIVKSVRASGPLLSSA